MNNKSIALVVGAGAVENSWNPIIRAFKKVCKWELDADGANFSFARIIYLMRFYSQIKHPEAKENFDVMKENITILKEQIAEELKIAQATGEIYERKAFKAVLEKFIFSNSNRFCLISTNWDTVIDNSINSYIKLNNIMHSDLKTFHIHGSINSPEHMYLPSEITNESYRTEEEDKLHGSNHASMISLLHEANTIVIYGLSLDPLDAELSQALFAGMDSKKLEKIIIVNPDHTKIAKRMLLLLNTRGNMTKVKIECYNPLRIN